MDQQQLAQAMDLFATKGKWFVSMGELRELFQDQSAGLKVMMHRHVHAGIVGRIATGIYVHAKAQRMGKATIPDLLKCLRPNDRMYVSLDSALRAYGRDAKGDPSTLFLMTSGLSYSYLVDSTLFKSLFGFSLTKIELIHTRRTPESLLDSSWGEIHGGVPLASELRALEDMTRTCRRLPPGQRVPSFPGSLHVRQPMETAAA